MEMEQANIEVEVAKKKAGPTKGPSSDVAMLLELVRPHLNSLDARSGQSCEKRGRRGGGENGRGEAQGGHARRQTSRNPTQLDVPETENREIASQMQAMEARRQAE